MQCSAIRPQTEPDLMGWDPGSRLNLSSSQQAGVVAVRYKAEGCNVELEVLNCTGTGAYTFSPYAATESKVAKSSRDLFAELPIGAARFGSKVGGGRALRTDYMLTGVYRLDSQEAFDSAKLRGSGCEQATHVVSKLYVGGFAMASGLTEKIEAGASVFGVGAGGAQDRSAERIASEGNAEACDRAQREGKPEPLCSVPLRVGLVPIAGRSEGSCPAGATWDGSGCVQKEVRTEVVCPAGSKLENGACVAAVSTACPAGMSFRAGQGCVANVVPPPSPAGESSPAPSPGSSGPSGAQARAKLMAESRKTRQLLVTELQGLESLQVSMPATSPDRPQLLYRLVAGYVELEGVAARDRKSATTAASAGKTAAMAERTAAVAEKIEMAARRSAAKHCETLTRQHGPWCRAQVQHSCVLCEP